MRESPLENWFREHESGCKYDMGGTIMSPPPTFNDLLSLGFDMDKPLGYSSISGEPELLNQIRKYMGEVYGADISDKQITLTNGGAEGIFLSIASQIKPGDKVMIITPAYPQYEIVAEALGGDIIYYPLDYTDNRWELNINDFCYELGKIRPDYLIINFPHNPTGITLTPLELRQIGKTAAELNIHIIHDSVYRGYGIESSYLKGHTSVYSFSKGFNLPGLRLGWVVSENKPELIHLKENISLSVNSISVAVATELLKNHGAIYNENLSVFNRNRKIFRDWVDMTHGIADNTNTVAPFSLVHIEMEGESDPAGYLGRKGIFTVPADRFSGGKEMEMCCVRVGYGEKTVSLLQKKLKYASVAMELTR